MMSGLAVGVGKVVGVTGSSGYIASWLVKLLLQRGYTVRASVRDLSNPKKTEHLRALDGASVRLHLFKADLLEEGSFDALIDGCEGVFHTASPFYHAVTDPQAELIEPAVKGTLNVLASCKKFSVKRVVVTSSMAAVAYNGRPRNPDVVVDETWFSSPEVCKEAKQWYVLSKTLAEEAAWKFSKENAIDIVTINPAMVIGTLLQPTLNTSSEAILNLMKGSPTFPNASFGWVNVQDVANAHILAYEVPSASGRYCLVERVAHFSEILKIIRELYPAIPLPHTTPFSRHHYLAKFLYVRAAHDVKVGELHNIHICLSTEPASISCTCENGKSVISKINFGSWLLFKFHSRKDQRGEGTLIATLGDPSYKLELSSSFPSVELPKAKLQFPNGEVLFQEKKEEEAQKRLCISGFLKLHMLDGISIASYSESALDLRYCYKDQEMSFIPSLSLPSNVLSFTFKRRFSPSDKLSYRYCFDSCNWTAVYKHILHKDYKFRAGYDSGMHLGWASLWVGDEHGKAKTAPMKMKLQFRVQVPQDRVGEPAFMFRVKKRWDF